MSDLLLVFLSLAASLAGVFEIIRMLFGGGNPPLSAMFFFLGLLFGLLAWMKTK